MSMFQVTGWVRDADNKALAGASLVAEPGHHQFPGVTQSDGAYVITGLDKAKKYTVTVALDGCLSKSLPLKWNAGDPDTLQRDFALDVWRVDDGDADYQETGSAWGDGSLGGYGGGYRYHAAGGGSNTASWKISPLQPGCYKVYATWKNHGNRASNACFSIKDGANLKGARRVNQKLPPNDVNDGTPWQNLGNYSIANGSLTVTLTDHADGYVIADAIRALKRDQAPAQSICDDTDADYQETGPNWGNGSLGGYDGGYRYHQKGTGADKARWTIAGLQPGCCEVFVTWKKHVNRAKDAPFTIFDGATPLGTVLVNQQEDPVDDQAAGVGWRSLGSFTINTGTLAIELSNDADGYVIADAVRVLR